MILPSLWSKSDMQHYSHNTIGGLNAQFNLSLMMNEKLWNGHVYISPRWIQAMEVILKYALIKDHMCLNKECHEKDCKIRIL